MTEQDFERLCAVVDQTNANDADKEALKHALKYQITVSSLEASLRGGMTMIISSMRLLQRPENFMMQTVCCLLIRM